MRELTLVRHGESEHHVKGYTGGWTDLPLTERGREQARRTARYLRDVVRAPCTRIFSSDLSRARGTAELLAETLALDVYFSPALRELNNGVARNLSQAEATRIELPRTESSLDWIPYPEAESWRMMFQRVAAFLVHTEAATPEPPLIVSHGNAMTCIILWWLRLTEDRHLESLTFDLEPCSVTRLRLDSHGNRCVLKVNDTAHLLARPDGELA
jgi:2,3-bisphosphoglycerate-dependent phosphoglycerate mutase